MSVQQGSAILTRLRQVLTAKSLDALIVVSSDPHNSEYVADRFKCRAFVSNFYGSAGTCLITPKHAYLWTDGRYWLEAEKSLYGGGLWHLMKDGELTVLPMDEWIERHLIKDGAAPPIVGVDPLTVTVSQWEKWSKRFQPTPCGGVLEPLMEEFGSPLLLDGGGGRVEGGEESPPSRPFGGFIFPRPHEFCGKTTEEKVTDLCDAIKTDHGSNAADFLMISALDEVAWLTNLRGSDVPYNPVFYAYALLDVKAKRLHLFVEDYKKKTKCGGFNPAVENPAEHYWPPGLVVVHGYKDLITAAAEERGGEGGASSSLWAELLQGKSILVDENQCSRGLVVQLEGYGAAVKRVASGPIARLKARKNSVELQGFRDCHVRDGVALTRFLAWITDAVGVQRKRITEWEAAEVLETYRRQVPHFVQLSFASISSSGPNGATIHYSPTRDVCSVIEPDALYLIDSGGQYLDGTTDVTRTVSLSSSPRAEEMEAYSLVLKGNIALNRCVFPKGTTGHRLDCLARTALWQVGLNYAHGTGHGVGSFLNVHEGPHGIGMRPTATGATLEASMIVSNEPGFYKTGSYGIRIENLEVIAPVTTKYHDGDFLGFETLTMAPLCRELIDVTLLTAEEVAWVDKYHARVAAALAEPLTALGDSLALQYLQHHCRPLTV